MDNWDSYFNEMAQLEALNPNYGDFVGLPLYARDPYADEGGFGDVGISPTTLAGGVEEADQAYRTSPASGDISFGRYIKDLLGAGGAQKMLGQGLNFATSKAGAAGIAALLAALDRQRASGGGTGQAYQGPKQYNRNITQGKYGPIVRYAAEGGLMQAYANGGHVRPFPMQDGGFVMTGDAVQGAGGIDNLQQILPEARPITGPGTATSDSIPATIRGRNGVTPAKVSNGEAYVPPGRDTKGLYALMRELERKA